MGLDPESLKSAFQTIISGVRTCQLSLEGEVMDGMADQCRVTVDGNALPFNGQDGWQLNNPSEIEVLGTSCAAILMGEVENLAVFCPCDSYVI